MNKWLIVMVLVGSFWGSVAQAEPYVGEDLPPNDLVIKAINDINNPSWFRGFINRIGFIGHAQEGDEFRLYYAPRNSVNASVVTVIRLDTGLWILPHTKNGQKKHYIIQR